MEPAVFPYDVRHDISFYGLKISKLWIPITGLVGAAFLFLLDIPFLPLMFKLLLLVLAPFFLFVFFVFDVGQWVKKIREFTKESTLRLPDNRGGENSLQSLIGAKARQGGGPFLDYKGYVGILIAVDPLPWEAMTQEDRTMEVGSYQMALSRALVRNIIVSIYTDFDLELPRVEIERKALEWRTRFPEGTRLRALAESRLAKFRDSSFRPVKPVYYIRLLWKPTNRDLPRKPLDESEKDSLTAVAFSSLIDTFTGILSNGGIKCMILGAEAARDIVSRQLNPTDWRRVAPVTNTCWEGRLALQQNFSKIISKEDDEDNDRGLDDTNLNLVAVVSFEKGLETKLITLHIAENLVKAGYSVSLIDADINYPGSMNAEFGIADMPADWRSLQSLDRALTPYQGLIYWGLSKEFFSVELNRTSFLKVIEEARKWSHVQIVHLGENEGSIHFLAGKAKVITVAGKAQPDVNTALKFSKNGALLVSLNEKDATIAAKNYRTKRCLVLERDIEYLVNFASGRSDN